MYFLYVVLLYAVCDCAQADIGVVIEFLTNEKTPVPVTHPHKHRQGYKQFLECSYEHSFESVTKTSESEKEIKPEKGKKPKKGKTPKKDATVQQQTTHHRHVFILQCFQSDSEGFYVILFFNDQPIEKLSVTSCNRNDVPNSIFPPKLDPNMKETYGKVYNKDQNTPLDLLFVYKTRLGKCFTRLYRYILDDKSKFTHGEKLTEISITSCVSGAKFSNCQAPSEELKNTVIQLADRDPQTPLILADLDKPTTMQLECNVEMPGYRDSDCYYQLICVKAQKTPGSQEDKFYATVNYIKVKVFLLERFAVKSCNEDDIVNAIFPTRLYAPLIMYPGLTFKHPNGFCADYLYMYARDPTQNKLMWQNVDCPSNIVEWVVNRSVMWRNCKGPTSNSGVPFP